MSDKKSRGKPPVKPKTRLTRKLLPLLKDLVTAQADFDRLTELLKPGADLDGRELIDVGAEREAVRIQILALAKLITTAATK